MKKIYLLVKDLGDQYVDEIMKMYGNVYEATTYEEFMPHGYEIRGKYFYSDQVTVIPNTRVTRALYGLEE